MSLFDRFREFADRLSGKAPRPKDPPIDSKISSAWANASSPRKPSLFDRFKEGARNLFKTSKAKTGQAKPANVPKAPSNIPKSPSFPTYTPKHLDTPFPTKSERKYEVFKFRRNSSEDGNAFYRLTQSIWDVPDVSKADRDKAIFEYYRDKYGLTDPNEIYDKVMRDNAELIEKYRNSPNALKYELLKNFKVEEAAL